VNSENISRRDAIKMAGAATAVGTLAGLDLPQVYAGGRNDTIQIALIGCGGRGTGAAINALSSQQGRTRLVAMADVFTGRLSSSLTNIQRGRPGQVEVPEARRFVSFDGYRRAMDCLAPGDVVILATPPAFRWVHFTYAIEKRLNVFMEKPISVDGPSTRRMFSLAEQSERAGLKVGVGLMCRHCSVREELRNRIRDGAIGDLMMLRAYRQHGPEAHAFCGPKPEGISELLYQIREFHAFLWASGGCYSDFLIHNIDECCWMKDAWPVKAKATGGRHYRGNFVDQNLDTYSVEYTFADGTKLLLEGRTMPGCHQEFASYAHGTRGSAIISANSHSPCRAKIFRGHNFVTADIVWRGPANEPDPYQEEWEHLMAAIRNNRAYNEVRRGAEASLACVLGRLAAHSGQLWTRDDALNHEHEFAPQVDRLTLDSASPLPADANGKYPVPRPGVVTRREY
jgi:predicted dehydrogenase